AHIAKRLKCGDAGGNPDERQETVDRPHRAPGRARRQEAGQNLVRIAVEYLRVVESRGEKGEDAHERERSGYQKRSSNSDRACVAHRALDMRIDWPPPEPIGCRRKRGQNLPRGGGPYTCSFEAD